MSGGLKGGRIGFADRVLVNRARSGLGPSGVARLRGEVSTFRDHTIAALPPFHPASNTAEGQYDHG